MGRDHDQRAFRLHVRGFLVAGALALLSLSARATFVNLPPPSGVSGGTVTTGSDFDRLLGQPSNVFKGPKIPAPGSTVPTIPTALKLGAGAARALARASALGLAVEGVLWLKENCFEQQGGQWVRTCGAGAPEQSTGDEYRYVVNGNATAWLRNKPAACDAASPLANTFQKALGYASGYTVYNAQGACQMYGRDAQGADTANGTADLGQRGSGCPAGWYYSNTGQCVETPSFDTVTTQQIEDGMADKPLPPKIQPGVQLPLSESIPSIIISPDPANPAQSVPVRVPQGAPVPIPNTNPTTYKQPWTTITPAPTAAEPMRVDTKPESTTTNSPAPPSGPVQETGTQPNKTPEEKEPDLCEKHPEIIACQKIDFDTPDGEIPKEDRNVSFQEQSLFGAGQCPADVYANLGTLNGLHVKLIDWRTFCGWAVPLRALVIALAALTACFIILPGGRTE